MCGREIESEEDVHLFIIFFFSLKKKKKKEVTPFDCSHINVPKIHGWLLYVHFFLVCSFFLLGLAKNV